MAGSRGNERLQTFMSGEICWGIAECRRMVVVNLFQTEGR